MKKIVSIIALVLFGMAVLDCSGKKEANGEAGAGEKEETGEWKEMDEFHMVMAETFHPYKDSANLEPVKSRAGELSGLADKWSKAPLPGKVDNDETKSKLQELRVKTDSLQALVKTGKDEQIGQQLTKVHDLFHEIQEAWYEGGENHH